jgi:hypothetical protein
MYAFSSVADSRDSKSRRTQDEWQARCRCSRMREAGTGRRNAIGTCHMGALVTTQATTLTGLHETKRGLETKATERT